MRTEKQTKALLDYLLYLKSALCLVDWTLLLADEPPGNADALACVEPISGRKLATIRLCSDFCSMPADRQTHSLVHELVHLHHISATDIIRIEAASEMSQSTYYVLWSVFKRQMEYCVDGLADAITPMVAPINYGKGKK